MSLTSKQEHFARLVAEGNSQADAYRVAFSSKAKPDSVQVAASRLMADSNVSLRVASLKQDLAEKSLWTRLDSVQVLAEIARGNDPEAKTADRVSATKALNQMHGWDKINIDLTSGGKPIKSFTDLYGTTESES